MYDLIVISFNHITIYKWLRSLEIIVATHVSNFKKDISKNSFCQVLSKKGYKQLGKWELPVFVKGERCCHYHLLHNRRFDRGLFQLGVGQPRFSSCL